MLDFSGCISTAFCAPIMQTKATYSRGRSVLHHNNVYDVYVHLFPAHLFSIISGTRRDIIIIPFARVLGPSVIAGVG